MIVEPIPAVTGKKEGKAHQLTIMRNTQKNYKFIVIQTYLSAAVSQSVRAALTCVYPMFTAADLTAGVCPSRLTFAPH